VLFDFGATWAKRGYAVHAGGELVRLALLPALPSPCRPMFAGERIDLSRLPPAEEQAEEMVATISASWQELKRQGREPDGPALVAMACHLRQGQPPATEVGCYGRLQQLGDLLEAQLDRRLKSRLGPAAGLRLFHDGSAAATFFAGSERTAVLTLGTAIGVGFAPPAEGLRAISTGLEVRPAL
jgi:hypothetical protein